MTWYRDGSPYRYEDPDEPGLTCAGWLGKGHAFRQDPPPDGFVDRLAWLCRTSHDRAMRGFHVCDLCPDGGRSTVSLVHEGEKHLLGSAEITVQAGVARYAAPNLVLHYVAAHGYLPPDDLVAAVMEGPAEHALAGWSLYTGPYWTPLQTLEEP